jgi:hypothetical protein
LAGKTFAGKQNKFQLNLSELQDGFRELEKGGDFVEREELFAAKSYSWLWRHSVELVEVVMRFCEGCCRGNVDSVKLN